VGARPRALLDYLVLPPGGDDLLPPLLRGVGEAAAEAGAEVVGGETARVEGTFDVAAAAGGPVEAEHLVERDRLAPGDYLIGLPSSGLHCNGIGRAADEGLSTGDLLVPTASYAPLADAFDLITGAWHVTGGGLGNLLRGSRGLRFMVDAPLPTPEVFGGLPPDWGTWNLGTGFVCSAREPEAEAALASLFPGARRIGEVTEPEGYRGYGQVAVPRDGWEHRG
jgi:phosphoribosylformylglycinamidine cyclo-ligase